MNFVEKDLEDIIYEATNEDLIDRGLVIHGKKYRQLSIGNYGKADIVTMKKTTPFSFLDQIDNYLDIQVIELKNNSVDVDSFIQLSRYIRGITFYLEKNKPELDYRIMGILIGRTLDKGAFCYLPDLIPWLKIYTYKYELSGMRFIDEYGYRLIDNKF